MKAVLLLSGVIYDTVMMPMRIIQGRGCRENDIYAGLTRIRVIEQEGVLNLPEGVLRMEEDELDVILQVQGLQWLGQPAPRVAKIRTG